MYLRITCEHVRQHASAGKKWFLQPSVNTQAGEASSQAVCMSDVQFKQGAFLAKVSMVHPTWWFTSLPLSEVSL